MQQYQDAGVDQVIFIQQAGRNTHADIIASLELFAAEVMPVMKADQAARDARKQAELAPYIEAALKRKKWMRPLRAECDSVDPRLWPFGRRERRHTERHRSAGAAAASTSRARIRSEKLRAVGDD